MTSSEYGKQRRMAHLLRDGKMLVVPVDDSLISGPYKGLFNIRRTIGEIERSQPNAILGFKGSVMEVKLASTPIIINITASTTMGNHILKVITSSVSEVIKMDADCVAVHVNYSCEYENQMLRQLGSVAEEAGQYGLPVLAISYPRKSVDGKDYNFDDLSEQDFTNLICHCTRASAELGADIIKTRYTGSCESFKRVVDSAFGRPVIVAGGPLIEVEKSYEIASAVMKAGGTGISYGRNVFNQKNIGAFIEGIKAIIFDGVDVNEALEIYGRMINV